MSQQAPVWGKEAVVPLAIEFLRERDRVGTLTYGMPLMTHNGRSAKLDKLEEAADLFLYFYQECREEGLV
jgi:hypothetical protein